MAQLAKVASGGYDSLMNRPEALRAPAELRDFWTSVTSRLKDNRTPAPGVRYNAYTDMQFRIAGALARAGVPLLTGTDLPNVVLVPGYSLHRELAMLVEAGLTPYQALEASTSAPARVFGQVNDWGTVEVGRRANLLMVDSNPLADLSTLRTPRTVVLNGNVYDDAQLRAMRDGTAPARR